MKTITEEQAIEMYDEMLNEVNGDFMGHTASYTLQQTDPIMYNCGFTDFIESLLQDNIEVEGF